LGLIEKPKGGKEPIPILQSLSDEVFNKVAKEKT